MSDSDYTFDPVIVDPGESFKVELDLFAKCANYWRANEQVGAGEYIRPTRPNGFSHQNAGSGFTTGAREPNWSTTLGGTTPDGSGTWTTAAASANGINPITSPSAVSDPTGLTIGSVSASESTKILATYSGGLEGQDYDAVFTFTLNGVSRVARQTVKVRKR